MAYWVIGPVVSVGCMSQSDLISSTNNTYAAANTSRHRKNPPHDICAVCYAFVITNIHNSKTINNNETK